MSRKRALLYLVLTAALWSFSGVTVKMIDWNPLAIASGRSLIAGITISLLLGRGLRFKEYGRAHWMTGFFLAGVSFSFVAATKLTTAANAILLQYTAPAWVAILSPWFLGERVRKLDWFFVGLVFTGMALFFKGQLSPEGLNGNLLAVLSGLLFGGTAMSLKSKGLKGDSAVDAVILGNFLAFILGLYFWRPPWPGALAILVLIFSGVVQFGISYYLYSRAASSVSSLEMVVITTIEPIVNPVWVWLILGERPGGWALLGGLFVLSSVTVWSFIKARAKPSHHH